MEPNVPLLRKVVEWVEWQDQLTEGRQWDQEWWFTERVEVESPWCDTVMCIAGKVALDDGWVPTRQRSADGVTYYDNNVVKNGETRLVWDVAAELLGLDSDEADALFGGDNEAHDIRRIAEEIAGERL